LTHFDIVCFDCWLSLLRQSARFTNDFSSNVKTASAPPDQASCGNDADATVLTLRTELAREKAANAQLREQIDELSQFVENASVGLHWVGPDGIIQWANPAEYEMLGYQREDYIGHHIAEFHADQAVIGDILTRLTRGERLIGQEARLKCKDGSIKTVLIDSCVLWRKGKFQHTQCFTRNITERKRMEEHLQFLGSLSASITPLESPNEIASQSARLLCQHFGASRVNFSDIDLAANEAAVFASDYAPGLKEDRITHSLDSYLPASVLDELRKGQQIAISDVVSDRRTAALAHNYGQWNIRSMVISPLLTERGWEFMMVIHKSEPYAWAPQELAILPEIISRIYSRIARARALGALRASEERFRAVIDNSTAVIYVKDLEGRYLMMNECYARILNTSVSFFIGKTDADLFSSDVAAGFGLNDREVVRTGKAIEIEETAPHPDGPHTYLSVKFPLRNSEGNIYAVAGVSTDITERKRAELSSARLAAVVESSDDAIITKNLEGIITSWNKGAECIFGYTAAEAVGKPVTILIPPQRLDEEPNILARLRRGERIDHYETVRRRKDGSLLDISLTISPIRDRNGVIVGASKIARDVTELRKAREAIEQSHAELETRVAERTASLEQAIAQMEDFSYTVSHDLRSPVRAIQGFSQAAVEDYGSTMTPEIRAVMDRVMASATRMEQLIRDILEYSRVGRAQLKIVPTSLDHLLACILHEDPSLQAPRAVVTLHAPLGSVLAHEASLSQVLTNLLRNAVKFVRPGVRPEVEVWTERREGALRVWIKDNGIGIKPQYHQRLFQVFERIHDSTLYEGTGIGLAIVRKAVDRMGGQVGVESDGFHGASFWIELPTANP
jgi:PAS domain S-box-containing protein